MFKFIKSLFKIEPGHEFPRNEKLTDADTDYSNVVSNLIIGRPFLHVKIKKIHPSATTPVYATSGSSGFDLSLVEDLSLFPREVKLARTGLSFEIPEGYELQIRPRSGLSLKTPLRIANSPGTVDSDYRGEVCIIVENTAQAGLLEFKKGDRIAQGVLVPIIQAVFNEGEIDQTLRGSGGFGHSGVNE